jgi:hypothetical protein
VKDKITLDLNMLGMQSQNPTPQCIVMKDVEQEKRNICLQVVRQQSQKAGKQTEFAANETFAVSTPWLVLLWIGPSEIK